MSNSSNVIHVPKPSPKSFNMDRPIVKNGLLLNQVEHFKQVENRMPPEKRSGVDHASIQTEGQAAAYIKKMTAILHPKVQKAKG